MSKKSNENYRFRIQSKDGYDFTKILQSSQKID
jgi:hypothetical protein